jgi:ABC-type sugar transport system ATPase subunit
VADLARQAAVSPPEPSVEHHAGGDAGPDAQVDEAALAHFPDAPAWDGRELTVGIRPESMGDAPAEPAHTLIGEVELIEALGAELHVHVRLTGSDEPFVARFPPRSPVRVADTLKVAVDVGDLHLFDPETGVSLRGDRR